MPDPEGVHPHHALQLAALDGLRVHSNLPDDQVGDGIVDRGAGEDDLSSLGLYLHPVDSFAGGAEVVLLFDGDGVQAELLTAEVAVRHRPHFLGVGADEAHFVRVDPVWQDLVVVRGVLGAGRRLHLLHGAQDCLAVIVGGSRAAATLPVNHMAEYG